MLVETRPAELSRWWWSADRTFSTDYLKCAAVIIGCFAIVYWMSLSFVYVEGDDAQTVAYHVLGRNPRLALPYNAYHSMMDTALSILPAREEVVRVAAIALSAVAAPIFVVLIITLVFEWCGDILPTPRWPLAVTVLLATPEFFYLGMVFTPAIVAMTFLLTAHLIARYSITRGGVRVVGFVASIVLFGVGAAIRWDTTTYGAVIVVDLGLRADPGSFWHKRVGWPVVWGVLALIAWLAVIYANGYSVQTLFNAIRTQNLGVIAGGSFDWRLSIARIHTLVTPLFALLLAVGIWRLLRERKWHLFAILLISALPLGRVLPMGVPKWIITLTPILLVIATCGLAALWEKQRLRAAAFALAIVPWLVGIQMQYPGVAWGPGFELQPYDRIVDQTSRPFLTVGPGMAIPTPEGPRPLFGHAWVLAGAWKEFVDRYWFEQKDAVRTSIDMRIPLLLQDTLPGWGIVAYTAIGYTTTDPLDRTLDDDFVVERRWDGPVAARMLQLTHQDQLFDPDAVDRLRRVAGDTVVITAFSKTLGRLSTLSPDAFEKLGLVAAVLHLDRLATGLRLHQLRLKSAVRGG